MYLDHIRHKVEVQFSSESKECASVLKDKLDDDD